MCCIMAALASSSSHFVLPRVPNMITLRAKKGNEITALDVLMTIFFFSLHNFPVIPRGTHHENTQPSQHRWVSRRERFFLCVCACSGGFRLSTWPLCWRPFRCVLQSTCSRWLRLKRLCTWSWSMPAEVSAKPRPPCQYAVWWTSDF